MRAICIQAWMEACRAAMEHWARKEPTPQRFRAIFARIDERDKAAREKAMCHIIADAGER